MIRRLPRPGLGQHGGFWALLPHQSSLQASWGRLELAFFFCSKNAWENFEMQDRLFPPNPVCTVACAGPKLLRHRLKWGKRWSMLGFGVPIFEQPWTTQRGQGRFASLHKKMRSRQWQEALALLVRTLGFNGCQGVNIVVWLGVKYWWLFNVFQPYLGYLGMLGWDDKHVRGMVEV